MSRKTIFVLVFIFLLSFTTKFYRLAETPLYPDEITWMVRAKETALAIRTLRLDYFDNAWWNTANDTEAIALPLTTVVGVPLIYLAKDTSVLSFNLFQDYVVGRTVVITLSSFFLVAFYLFVKKLGGKKVALLASVLLALDPVFSANSKLIMNDLMLSAFMFVSIASYLLVKNNFTSILFSSLFVAASFLTKPNGLLVLPVFAAQIFLNRKSWKKETKKFLLTLFFSFVFISLFWPNAWNNPLGAIFEYLARQGSLVGGGINNFFAGKLTNNPPFYYYFYQLVTRIPPMVLLGFWVGVSLIFRCKKDNAKDFKFYLSVVGFLLLFLVVMSLSPKKLGARYILPLWPWIYLIASIGIVSVVEGVKGVFAKKAVYVALVLWFAGVFGTFSPNHYLYYNELVGGPGGAQNNNLVGLCSGSKQAVDYVLRCYPQVEQIASLGCGKTTIPYYYPHSYNANWKNADVIVVENYYLQLRKDPELNEFYEANPPTYTIDMNGAKLAHIYVKGNIENKCN